MGLGCVGKLAEYGPESKAEVMFFHALYFASCLGSHPGWTLSQNKAKQHRKQQIHFHPQVVLVSVLSKQQKTNDEDDGISNFGLSILNLKLLSISNTWFDVFEALSTLDLNAELSQVL